jgi:hypothetical protein
MQFLMLGNVLSIVQPHLTISQRHDTPTTASFSDINAIGFHHR